MLSKSQFIYPKCFHSLKLWLEKSKKKMEIYNKINPQLFDVTLRDGLQTVSKDLSHIWTTQEKKNMYYKILFNHKPQKCEIGSLTNPKILPIFNDSLELLKELNQNLIIDLNNPKNNKYILIPNFKMFKKALEADVNNFSFITSVSNEFQKKNTNMTIHETKEGIHDMINLLSTKDSINTKDSIILKNYNIKLYISCISECPLMGQIDINFIISEILYYNNFDTINELCLSDTCGTLKFDDFKYIIERCIHFGLPLIKLSLHLHCSDENMENTKKILNYSLDKKINKFDVSMLNSGGCTVTMSNEKCNNNLSYDTFYKILVDYIENNVDK